MNENLLPQNDQNNNFFPPVDPNKITYYNSEPVNSPKYTDSDKSEDEGISSYKINGYHPVHIGEVLLERYIIMQKLGYGHFSTAWLALDTKFGTYVAIKIQKSAQQYIDAAYDEVEILQELANHNFDPSWLKSLKEYYKDEPEILEELESVEHTNIVQLLNSFIYYGQNGRHFCMVFEIVGVTLLELIKRYNYKGIPLPFIRIITKQILIGLDFLHRICHIIHTDLKPENVLVCLTNEELKTIQETGHLEIEKAGKKKKNKKNNNESQNDMSKNGMSGKQMRKKRNKFKKKQIKKLEKMGLSPQEIEIQLKIIMDKKEEEENNKKEEEENNKKDEEENNKKDEEENNKKDEEENNKKEEEENNKKDEEENNKKEEEENNKKDEEENNKKDEEENNKKDEEESDEDSDIEDYDIDDLIERPRILSIPKININVDDSEENIEDEEEENLINLGIKNPHFNVNLMDYSKSLKAYLREKKRIIQDDDYKKNMILQNEMLSKAKTEFEKEKIKQNLKEKFNRKGPEISPSIEVKICDVGNACWFNHHFSSIIQTRQYRAPEVLLGINYNESSDIWSLACMVFELATGDFLFDPRKGDTYSKNDDHLAQIIELAGKMPKNFALSGSNSMKYFNKNGKLKRIKKLVYYPLIKVLTEKYHFKENEAKALNDFIMPMLEYYPNKRITARELLRHPWLNMPANFDYKLSDIEVEKKKMIKDNIKDDKIEEEEEEDISKLREVNSSDESIYGGDIEDNDEGDNNDDDGEDGGDDNPDKVLISNFNNSFAEYGQFVDLTSLDRANPQFQKINKKKNN